MLPEVVQWNRELLQRVNGAQLRELLVRRAAVLPRVSPDVRYIVCARNQVDDAAGVLPITAAEIFS